MVLSTRQSRIVGTDGQPLRVVDSNRNRLATVDWKRTLNRYDAAQTSDDNIRHWSWSDSMSADAANSVQVRRILRNRSRYEAANNSYCRSMVETLANDVIGTGPRVQIVTGAGDAVDKFIERELLWWMHHAKVAKRLRTMRKSKCVDGEGIGLFITKERLPTPVKLAIRTIESEQLSTPTLTGTEDNAIDGIRFDADGDPLTYDILRYHPGANSTALQAVGKADRLPASDVIHIFREDRPGQHRGIPELTPALPLFSQLRRFTLATLAAAETAAEFAAVIETTRAEAYGNQIAGDDAAPPEPMDVFELAQRMVTVLPDGYKLNQVKPEHPSTTYGEFKREILAEAFSAVVMPYAVGGNDSKDYNFASGKLDRRGYAKAVAVERFLEWEPEAYRLVYSWWLEAKIIRNYLPASLPPFQAWNVQIFWDEVEDDIDPTKAASARETELASGQISFPTLFARRGLDYAVEHQRQADALGISLADFRKQLVIKLFHNGNIVAEQQAKKATSESDPKTKSE